MTAVGVGESVRHQLILRNARGTVALSLHGPTRVGRTDAADVQVAHASVSSWHAEIEDLAISGGIGCVTLGETPSGGDAGNGGDDDDGAPVREPPVAVLRDLGSMNGTFADDEPQPGTRVPPEGTFLRLGDFIRFGFCPHIYRLEAAPREEPSLEDAQKGSSAERTDRRQQLLDKAEENYLAWLAQVRDEYASIREKMESAGESRMSDLPSLQELQETCQSFFPRPLSRCASSASRTGLLRPGSVLGERLPLDRLGEADESLTAGEVKEMEPPLAEIEQEVERLSGRSWEVASVMRHPINSEADLTSMRESLQVAHHFIVEELPSAAATCGVEVRGLMFQALLARAGRPTPGHAMRDRISAVELDVLTDVAALVDKAEKLCGMLRVKIEDDSDLALARTVLEDSAQFLDDLAQCAKWRGISDWELFAECNDA
eukprot:TRINITY_DN51465_c0_g1_i1.p1 TRINITY_DN51465_c0_g1~~TRINITY_DN51465_c0_g1_i1.p1  ORF type:complete len:432 (+),score=55.02 TRINITY_DN51465_c0_g1_i1:28-1323(+)